jgi:DNA-binding NarL/FixJ family response regulator
MDKTEPLRVFIYAPSNVMASSLALFFKDREEFEAFGCYKRDELLKGYKEKRFSFLLIFEEEVGPFTFGTIESLTGLNAFAHDVQIAVLGRLREDTDLFKLIKLGASGYFYNNMNIGDMLFYIRNIASGIPFYSMRVLAPLLKNLVLENEEILFSKPAANPSALSKQEYRIMKCICEGKTIKDISKELFISISTTKNHMSSIYCKMGVSNRTQALLAAIQTGLYTPPSL